MSVRKPTYEELAERVATLKSALDESGNAREQAEELLFSTLDALPSAIFTFDRAGVIAGWNSSCRDIYGFKDEEVIGKTIYETICRPEDAPATRELIGRVFKGETITGLEWDDIRKSGATVHMQTTACPVLDQRGRVVAGMSVNTDVTEHHRAEAAQRESEEQYRTLVENVNIGVYRNTGGPHGRFLQANLAIARMFGYDSVEEFMTVHVSDLYQDPEERKLFVEEALKRGFVKDHELRLRKKDGTPIWASCTAQIQYDENEEIKWFDGVIKDITKRKQAQEEIRRLNADLERRVTEQTEEVRESEERYRTLAESAQEFIFTTGRDSRIQYVNAYMARQARRAADTMIGRTLRDVFPRRTALTMEHHLQSVFKSEQPVHVEEEMRLTESADAPLCLDMRLVPLRDEGGEITAVFGIAHDMTRRKQAEEALRRSEERMRSIFENALVGIYRTTPAGRILLANPALVRMLGFDSFEELAERNLEEKGYEPEHARQEFKERMKRDGKVVGLETAWAKRDGTSLFVRESATAVRDDAGNIRYYEGTVEDITARKQAEEALRAAARNWQTTFDALSSSVCLIHMDGTVQQCNEAMAKLLGKTPAEIIGSTCWELVHGTSEPIEGCPFVRAQETCRRETMLLRAGDRWLDVSVDPVLDEDGRMLAAVHVISDVTDRKRAEEALRESEERYRAIFEQAADSIVLIDSDTAGLVEFNDRAHTNLGFTREEFAKLALADIDVLESEADAAEHVGKVIKSGSDIFETKQRAKNGDVRDIQVNSRPVSIHGKSYIHAIWRDVTEAKRARERVERQAKILANVTDVVAVLAADRTVTYWNRAAERTYGYSAEEVVGGAGLKFLMRAQDDNDELADQIRQAVKTEGRWSHPRWPALTKDGREIWVNVTLSNLDIGTDEPPGTLVVAKDVTEEVLLQERLIRTERLAAIGTLASGVAHEMNNLLGGLRGLSDVAASDPEMVASLIDAAHAVAVRGAAITARLTSLATADQPGADRRIDLPSAVVIAVRMVRPLFGQRRINIEEYYGPTPQTWVSEGKIFQVFLNLLVNARDSIDRDGTVRVAVEHDKGPDEFVITVSDTGAGIEPEDVPRLFDPFFTTKRETGPKGEAPSHLGLGLAESLSIVRDCGGDITVESTPGHGATFTVRLPVRPAPGSALAPPPAPPAEAMPEKGAPMLVVDDDKLMRFWLTKHLEEQGYGVTAVDNGRGALDALAETPFPYVFLDLLMPGEMDGVATFRKLKKTQPGAKVIIISAFTRDNIPKDCLDAAHAVLKKPFGTDDLARAFAGESTSA